MKAIVALPATLLLTACSGITDAGGNTAASPASSSSPVRVFGQQPPKAIVPALPEPREPGETWEVRMRRGACFGICPSYEVTLHEAGSVDIVGHEHAATTGPRQGK